MRLANPSRRVQVAVLLGWAVLVVIAIPFASRQVSHLTSGGFEVAGSQSVTAEKVLLERFPGQSGEEMGLLLQWQRGAVGQARLHRTMEHIDAELAGRPDLELGPVLTHHLPEGHEVILRPIEIHTSVRNGIDQATRLRSELHLGEAGSGPISTELVGRSALVAAVHEESEKDARKAESIGAPLVLLILLVVFGSFAAALLPLLVGAAGVVLTGALIYLISLDFAMSVFVVNVASMIGIGVAVDYSLFMLARFREEIAAGRSEREARETMLATSGRSIAFAGITVALSLSSIFLIDNVILRSIAAGAMIVVLIAVLVTVTAMPVTVALLGRRLRAPSPLFRRIGATLGRPLQRWRRPHTTGFWERWTARVMAHPARNAAAVTAVMLALSAPLLALHLGVDTVRQLSPGDPTRQGAELATSLIKNYVDSPIVVTATHEGDAPRQAQALRKALKRQLKSEPGIAWAEPTRAGRNAVLVEAAQKIDPESVRGQDLVRRVRARVEDFATHWPGWTIATGGTGATVVDASDQISGNLWKVVLAVLVISFVILLVLLRSIVLPLKAVLMNLLTVGAASGVLVAVFQWGWFQWAGIERMGHLEIYVPPLIFAVVFGISMDYEVFLMTRIRERYLAGSDNWTAVIGGVASSARTISSAALIMVVVFSTFVATGMPIIQEIGLGSAVAIALDATLVRLVLLPAAMGLLGDLNWWLPRSLARLPGGSWGEIGIQRSTEVGE
jgi:RND superfamily putative drug exporter